LSPYSCNTSRFLGIDSPNFWIYEPRRALAIKMG